MSVGLHALECMKQTILESVTTQQKRLAFPLICQKKLSQFWKKFSLNGAPCTAVTQCTCNPVVNRYKYEVATTDTAQVQHCEVRNDKSHLQLT